MDFKNENRHTIDVLFVITLFFVFALSALTLVILGANVYKNTVNHMDAGFNSRTSSAYIIQKLRQNDVAGSTAISDYNGTKCIVMTDEVNDTIYNTYLYEYEGYLCELLSRADMPMEPSYGTQIIALDNLAFTQINDQLYFIEICPKDASPIELYISSHTSLGGQSNE